MPHRSDVIAKLKSPGVIAVVRAPRGDVLLPLSRALLAGGVIAIEITLTTPNAIEGIRRCKGELGDDALIGVGTVLDASTCRQALDAGAEFVVSPITKAELVECAHAADRPIMLGAYTPTEAQRAYELSADFIKLFPADGLGPSYVRALRAPLPHLQIVPTGGVDLNTAGEFIRAGCVALGVGSSMLPGAKIESGDWSSLTELASAFVAAVAKARTQSR